MSENIPEIPQNSNINFKFKKNNITSSIEILINWKEPIDLENLYLIFKCIIGNNIIPVHFIYLAGSNERDKINIFRNIRIDTIKHMSIVDFIDWFEKLYADDERYLQYFSWYAIGFNLEKQNLNWINNTIYPIYPWNENFKKQFLPQYNIASKIKIQDQELKNLIDLIKIQDQELRRHVLRNKILIYKIKLFKNSIPGIHKKGRIYGMLFMKLFK